MSIRQPRASLNPSTERLNQGVPTTIVATLEHVLSAAIQPPARIVCRIRGQQTSAGDPRGQQLASDSAHEFAHG